MPPTRRRRVAVTAPPAAWHRLGELLERRRRKLGHTWRTTFEAESGVNKRLSADIESAAPDRINHFMPGTLQLIAEGYQVTHASMLAVLRGEADQLEPAPPAAVPVLPAAASASPFAAPRADVNRPWFDPLNERRVALALKGIADPDGARMFPDAPDDAKAWDSIGDPISTGDKVWIIADLRRREYDRRPADSGTADA